MFTDEVPVVTRSARRGFRENAVLLFHLSIMMFHAWALKDVVTAVIAFLDKPVDRTPGCDIYCPEESSSSYRLQYWGFVVGVAVGVTSESYTP